MTAVLLVMPCLKKDNALLAQIVPSSFFTETTVAPLSTQGPVLTNCDMRQDGNSGVLRAVVWSDNNNSDSWLYVEDWGGVSATLYFPGTVDPDVAFVSGQLPSGSIGTQVLVVYRQNDTAYLDIYDLNNIGAGLTVTSALSITTPTPSASLIKLGHASTPPHVDAAYDPTFTPGNIRDMHEFVCAWEDAGTIWYYWSDILLPTSPFVRVSVASNAHFSDVAFYTQAGSGGSTRFISLPYLNTASGNLEVVELDPAAGGPTTTYTLYTGGNAYAPRIAALDEWTRGNARWEVASSIQTSLGIGREVFGFNLLTGATNMSGILSFLYGPPPAYETMGACVAAGIGLNSGSSTDIGNTQYTVGFFPWAHDSNYARHVLPLTGQLITPFQCYQVNDATSPIGYHWDLNESMSVTNCSNTGMNIMTAWYNGTNIVYKYSSSNMMQFRQTKPNGMASAANAPRSAYGLAAGGDYSILDMNGKVVQRGQADGSGNIQTGDLAAGMYLLRFVTNEGQTKAVKFTK